jgi:hypothetical protein
VRRVASGTPGAVALAAIAVLLGGGLPSVAAGPAPLEQARRAAEQVSFEGVLEVQWVDGATTMSSRLQVQGSGGALAVQGGNQVMARPSLGPLLSHGGKGWEAMWLPSLGPGRRPDGVRKYLTTAPVDGPLVAGRPTRLVEVHSGGLLLERIYLDTETNLLLRREQFAETGSVVRTLAFQSIDLTPSTGLLAEPRSPENNAPEPVALDRLSSPAAAPPALADGYERMGVYRDGDVLHVLYSDGLYDLSLFQQQGRLRRSDLPPEGERVAVGDTPGWRYAWAGGQVIVWSERGRVFTAVSDAPVQQVLAAVRSMPPVPGRELSLLGKIRRACQALMEPLS